MKLAAVLVLGAGIAHADPSVPSPDEAARHAADANLESDAIRHGITLSAALGGSLTVGFGLNDSVGSGGAGSFRLGHTMSDNSVLTAELLFSAVVRKVGPDLVTNNDTNFMVGVQYFLGTSLYVRAALGIGDYMRNKVDIGNGVPGTRKVAGPAGVLGGGLEFLHARHVSLGVELFTLGMPNRDGFLSTSGFGLAGSYY